MSFVLIKTNLLVPYCSCQLYTAAPISPANKGAYGMYSYLKSLLLYILLILFSCMCMLFLFIVIYSLLHHLHLIYLQGCRHRPPRVLLMSQHMTPLQRRPSAQVVYQQNSRLQHQQNTQVVYRQINRLGAQVVCQQISRPLGQQASHGNGVSFAVFVTCCCFDLSTNISTSSLCLAIMNNSHQSTYYQAI